PLYPLVAAHFLACMLAAAGNVALGRRRAREPLERHHFGRLLVGAALFALGVSSLALYRLLFQGWPIWPSDLLVALGIAVIALDTSAYSLQLEKKVMGRDLLSYLVGLATLCLLYALLVTSAARGYSFLTLELLVPILVATVLSHAVLDP